MLAAARARTAVAPALLDAAGAAALAGAIAGMLVGGLGSRIAMRVAGAMSDQGLVGVTFTNNGNALGVVTIEGTLALVVFGGLLPGVLGGAGYGACRSWLAPLGRWGGLAFGLVLLGGLGYSVLEPFNIDFRKFGSPLLNVTLFALLFPLFGVAVSFAYDGIARRLAGASALSRWRWASWGALLVLALGLAVAIATGLGALITRGDAGDPRALVPLWLIAAPLVLRFVRAPLPVAYAVIAAPAVLGLPPLLEGILFLTR